MSYYCYDCMYLNTSTYKCNSSNYNANHYNDYVKYPKDESAYNCKGFKILKQYCEECKYYNDKDTDSYPYCTNSSGAHYNKSGIRGYYIEGRTGDYGKCFEPKSSGGILGYFFG